MVDSPPGAAARLHLWVLLPVLGIVPTALSLRHDWRPDDRKDVVRALRWQLLGTAILMLHAVLQLGVVFVDWFAHSAGSVPPGLEPLFGPLLMVISLVNVGSGIAEYCFVAFWGLRAARGAPLPFLDGSRG